MRNSQRKWALPWGASSHGFTVRCGNSLYVWENDVRGSYQTAAAYALGISRGAARSAIEARLSNDPALQAKIKLWQENFVALDLAAGRQAPPAGLFDTILDASDAGAGDKLSGTLTRRGGTGVWTEMSPGVTYSVLFDDPVTKRRSMLVRALPGATRAAGRSICAIARALQRAKSTVSRELRRNGLSSRRYSLLHAAGAYQLRRRREAIIEKVQKLRPFVCHRLAEGWTPEQIAGWLKAGNERRLRAVGCETIYAFIYRPYQKAERLWRYLTRRHKRRRPRRSRPSRDTIKDRVSIHERPKTKSLKV